MSGAPELLISVLVNFKRNVVPPRWLEHAESFQNSGWAPTGYAIDSETKEGGIDEGNDPTAGTDQPAEGSSLIQDSGRLYNHI